MNKELFNKIHNLVDEIVKACEPEKLSSMDKYTADVLDEMASVAVEMETLADIAEEYIEYGTEFLN